MERHKIWVQSLGWEDALEKETEYSCLQNPMEGGAWQATVHGVAKSTTRLMTDVISVKFSCSVKSNSLRPHELQYARPPSPSATTRVYWNSRPSSRWCHPTTSSSVIPFSSCLQSLPASGSFPRVKSLHEVAKVLEFQLQHQSFQWKSRTDLLQDGLAGSPCSPRDSQESSPTP